MSVETGYEGLGKLNDDIDLEDADRPTEEEIAELSGEALKDKYGPYTDLSTTPRQSRRLVRYR